MVEELFNGYMNMQMGVKYYHNNANSFDSLAEYYESVKDYKNALKNIKKTVELRENNRYFIMIESN